MRRALAACSLASCALAASAIAACALAACGDAATATSRLRRTRVALAYAPQASGLFPGPFVSVADSVTVTVVGSDGAQQTFGARLARRDTTVTFAVDLPDGAARFDGRVLSATGQVLFAGTQTATIAADGFVVRLQPTAQAPVLLLAPDTVHVPIGTSFPQGTLTVHNRGTGTLVARFRGPAPVPGSNGCAPLQCLPGGQFLADSVMVPARSFVVMVLRPPLRGATYPILMTVSSDQGSVPLVIASP